MSRRWIAQIGLVVMALSLTLGIVPIPAPAVEVGDNAPDFVMHSTVGETLRLSDYEGKKHVLLFFFVAAFTGV
jgi:peroxiredoxin Q/BCP